MKRVISTLCKIVLGLGIVVLVLIGVEKGVNIYKTLHFPKPIEMLINEPVKNILRTKLDLKGEIKVATSEQEFIEEITKRGVIGKHKFIISLLFKTDYCYDLKDVKILSEIENKSVIFEIDENKLFIDDVSIVKDDSREERSGFSLKVGTSEEELIRKTVENKKKKAFEEIEEKFLNDEEFKQKAKENLKGELIKIAQGLGFEQIEVRYKGEI